MPLFPFWGRVLAGSFRKRAAVAAGSEKRCGAPIEPRIPVTDGVIKEGDGPDVELVNTTPIPASLTLTDIPGREQRFGMIIAKATFRIEPTGTALETQDPVPLFEDDEKTELGLMPRDNLPRADSAFEVILLGAARAPDNRLVPAMNVALQVGTHRKQLRVFGDRVWQETPPDGHRISVPGPFTRMPLTYERAFGGCAEVLLDADSPALVVDPVNPYGRGLNVARKAEQLAEALYTADGYPVYDRARSLPNVEDPDHLIADWDDAPPPACWATVPMSSGYQAARSVDPDAASPDAAEDPSVDFDAPPPTTEHVFHRAHSDWLIPTPQPRTAVVIEGMAPEGALRFTLPPLRVFADYAVGDRTGQRELTPQTLVLLPEERRFYIVFRHLFDVTYDPEQNRRMRLQLDTGALAPASEG